MHAEQVYSDIRILAELHAQQVYSQMRMPAELYAQQNKEECHLKYPAEILYGQKLIK